MTRDNHLYNQNFDLEQVGNCLQYKFHLFYINFVANTLC
jgi:uncharacterized protein YhbP (UPF0306 family)